MKTVYAEFIEGVSYIPLLYPNIGKQKQDSILFLQHAFDHLTDPIVVLVNTPEEADAILLPHNFPLLNDHQDYTEKMVHLSASTQKPLAIFWHGDSDAAVDIDASVVFRTSQYKEHLRSNEVMMPAYAEDLLHGDLTLRSKEDRKPVVGFCGWADYKNFKNRIGTFVQNTYWKLQHDPVRIKGLTYRMKAIDQLLHSTLIQTNFIVRSSYSGHKSTIKTDPKQTRREYVDNLLSADYALAIKGDGNYSYRFYEALSLGRIPVLLDTDCILPLEDVIHYDEFIVRVPYTQLHRMDEIIYDHWNRTSPEEFTVMQKKAREVFEKYLRIDAFLAYAMNNLLPE